MDAPNGARGRIWLDVTTSSRAGAAHDGTTRIERGLIRELPKLLGERLGFCTYDTTMKRFAAVGQPRLPADGDTRRTNARNGMVRRLGRRAEQHLRRAIKGAAANTARVLDRFVEGRLFPQAAGGDVLLLAGENWSRYDFETLRRLRQDHGLRLAAVLQDVIPVIHPQFFEDSRFVARFRTYLDFLASDADLVLAISGATRDDFLEAAPGVRAERVERIWLGADIPASGQQRPPSMAGDEKPFVLSVSTIQARKNFDLLYRLWRRFAEEGRSDMPRLVIVGRPGFGSADLLHMIGNDPLIADTVTVLQRTSDVELAWLYANCRFTLYPSWYEGWGLPLSESLSFGKTFIASDRSSLPEAGQGLGIHVDPYDLMAWHREVLRLSHGDGARLALEKRIETERKLTSWHDCAQGVVDALDRLSIAR